MPEQIKVPFDLYLIYLQILLKGRLKVKSWWGAGLMVKEAVIDKTMNILTFIGLCNFIF